MNEELLTALKEFLAFGHPREGSNRYHLAWRKLEEVFKKVSKENERTRL